MSRSPRIQWLIKAAGLLLVVLAVVFVGHSITEAWDELRNWSPTATTLALLLGLAVAYGVVSLLTVMVWLGILSAILRIDERKLLLGKIHALSQLGKYIPGNVFHFAGRHAMTSKALGGGGITLGSAIVLEAATLVLAAIVVSLVAASLFMPADLNIDFLTIDQLKLMSVSLLALTLVTGVILSRYAYRTTGNRFRASGLLQAMLFAGLFFLGQAFILLAIVWLVSGEWLAWSLAVAPVAWILGFVVPGAPAGMGVREAAMIALFATTLSTGDAVLVALLFRFATVVGDVVFFLIGIVMPGGGILDEPALATPSEPSDA